MLNSKNMISYLKYHRNSFTLNEQAIALFFIENKSLEDLNIQAVAKRLYISTATLNRFAKKLDFDGYKDFIVEYKRYLNEQKQDSIPPTQVIENTHMLFFQKLYHHLTHLDLSVLISYLERSSSIYCFGFGKTGDIPKMMTTRMDSMRINTRFTTDLEHLVYTIKNVLTSRDCIIVFYHHDIFQQDLHALIDECKQSNIPIFVFTIYNDIDTQNYAYHINLFPKYDHTISCYSTTMYTPFLVLIDILTFYLNHEEIKD